MEPYARHVIVCTGGFRATPNREEADNLLAPRWLLQRENLLFGDRVKQGEVPC